MTHAQYENSWDTKSPAGTPGQNQACVAAELAGRLHLDSTPGKM